MILIEDESKNKFNTYLIYFAFRKAKKKRGEPSLLATAIILY
jgi:hypothetical protein